MNTKILIAKKYGQADVLEFTNQPLSNLAPGMARIQVKAAGINPIDARRMTGEFKHAGLPQTFGTEFAGIIADIDPQSSHWKVGDEVLGSGGSFTHATVIDVPIANLVARPATIDWNVAGSVAGVSQTAMTILDELGNIKSLLVHGASGGVGSIVIQIAKARGIDVVGTASAKNLDYVNSLGAIAVEYGEGLLDRLKNIHPGAFDASIDLAGSAQATEISLQVVKPSGIIGSLTGKPATSPRVVAIWVKKKVQNLQYVVDRIANGTFKWQIDKTFTFENAAEAYTEVLKGHTRGKIVLTF